MTKVIFKKAIKKAPTSSLKSVVRKTVKAEMTKDVETKYFTYYRYNNLQDNAIMCNNLLFAMPRGVDGVSYAGEQYFCKSIQINYILKQISTGSTAYQNTRHFRVMVIHTDDIITSTYTSTMNAQLLFKAETNDIQSGVYATNSFADRHKVRVCYEKYIKIDRDYPTQVKDYRGTINVKVNKKLTLDNGNYLGKNNYYLCVAFYDGSLTNSQVSCQADWQVAFTDI